MIIIYESKDTSIGKFLVYMSNLGVTCFFPLHVKTLPLPQLIKFMKKHTLYQIHSIKNVNIDDTISNLSFQTLQGGNVKNVI